MDTKPTMTVQEAAQLLGMNPKTVRYMIGHKMVSWGVCVKLKRNRYIIYRQRFETETGIDTKGGTTWRYERLSRTS